MPKSYKDKFKTVAIVDPSPEQLTASVVNGEPAVDAPGVLVWPSRGYADRPLRIDPTGTTVQPVSVVSGGGNSSVAPTGSPVPADGTYIAAQDVSGNLAGLLVDASGNLKVVAAVTIGAVDQGAPNTLANGWPVMLTEGTNVLGTSAHPLVSTLAAGSVVIGHVIVDSGTIAATQSGTWNIGTVATVSAVTAITNALPAGSNVIGHVIADSGSTTAVTGTVSTNIAQANGATINIGNGTAGTGTMRVVLASDQTALTNALPVKVVPQTTGGGSLFSNSVATTVTSIKASAGQLFSLAFFNNNTTPIYVQIFNIASGSVTLGTSTPVLSIGIPANRSVEVFLGDGGTAFSTAISIAATTSRAGAGAPANTVDVNAVFI